MDGPRVQLSRRYTDEIGVADEGFSSRRKMADASFCGMASPERERLSQYARLRWHGRNGADSST